MYSLIEECIHHIKTAVVRSEKNVGDINQIINISENVFRKKKLNAKNQNNIYTIILRNLIMFSFRYKLVTHLRR